MAGPHPWDYTSLEAAPQDYASSLRTDLRGKRIAYSPGQVQGEIVIRTLQSQGLTPSDVTLVELPSTSADVYINALVGGGLDVAPIGAGPAVKRYLDRFGRDGAKVLKSANPQANAIVVSLMILLFKLSTRTTNGPSI